MNLLTDQLPSIIDIDGRRWPVRTDFRACLKTILAFEDPDLTSQEKQAILLRNVYLETPPDFEKASKAAIKFLNGGQESEEADGQRLYSFSKDASFIYSAFRQTHGVDLTTAQMHWWQFLALFMDLGADTVFCNMVSFRKRYQNGKLTKEERREYNENRDLFDLPEIDTRTLEEKERYDEFMRQAKEGKYKEQIP